MARHNDLGIQGEKIALDYLKSKDYQILATNWRFSRAEIDIIAQVDATIVFVEVKTRSNNRFEEPEAAVNPKKEKLLIDAAGMYLTEINHEGAVRFDIISIVIEKNQHKKTITHIEDAFFDYWD